MRKRGASWAPTRRPEADRRLSRGGEARRLQLARCLIIGCGCRGRLLTEELTRQGHVVRGTTRDPSRGELIRVAGAEPLVADPDRIATLTGAFDHVSVTCVLLGSAAGSPTHLASLHGTRLEMLLARLLDTTVRGIVYERSGSVDPALLESGAELVRRACERSRIPYALLQADPLVPASWLEAAVKAVGQVLGAPSSPR